MQSVLMHWSVLIYIFWNTSTPELKFVMVSYTEAIWMRKKMVRPSKMKAVILCLPILLYQDSGLDFDSDKIIGCIVILSKKTRQEY